MTETLWVKIHTETDASGVLWLNGRLKDATACAGCSCGDPECREELIASVFHELTREFLFALRDKLVGIKVDGRVYRAPSALVVVSGAGPRVLH